LNICYINKKKYTSNFLGILIQKIHEPKLKMQLFPVNFLHFQEEKDYASCLRSTHNLPENYQEKKIQIRSCKEDKESSRNLNIKEIKHMHDLHVVTDVFQQIHKFLG